MMIGLILIGAVLVVLMVATLIEIMRAPMMPESWHDEIADYIPCDDCSWTEDAEISAVNEPGPGCRNCPFCHAADGQK